MLIRIVKLTFKEENISSFEQLFEETKNTIKDFKGCLLLELYQDKKHPNIFFTYSHWDDQTSLDAYRDSDFFKLVWQKTKQLFQEKAEAWSVNKITSLT